MMDFIFGAIVGAFLFMIYDRAVLTREDNNHWIIDIRKEDN